MADKLPRGLYGLVDDGLRPELAPLTKARLLFEGGVEVLQLRLKHAGDAKGLGIVREVMAWAAGRQVRVLVNDRVDWALVAGAHGVHLGADDLPVSRARAVLGPRAMIGATIRTLSDAHAAFAAGADYAGLGPVFSTTTKQLAVPTLGVEGFGAIARASPLPLVAIGGIGLGHAAALAQAGARMVAVGQGVWSPEGEPSARARSIQQAFCGH